MTPRADFPPLLHEALATSAAGNPDRVVLDFEAGTLTLGELDDRAGRLAGALAQLGVNRGDRVAVMLGNRPEMAVVQYALAKVGAVIVPVATAMRGEPLARYFSDSGAGTAIVEAGLLERVEAATRDRVSLPRLVTVDGDVPGAERLEAMMMAGRQIESPTLGPGDDWAVMYTSGTTGPAKGVILSHQFLRRQVETAVELSRVDEHSVIFSPAPLYHLQAICFAMNAAILTGARAVIRNGLPRGDVFAHLNAMGVTQAILPPFLLLERLRKDPAPTDRAGSLRTLLTIGLTREQWGAFEVRFDCRLVGAYGPTETGIVTRFQHDGRDRPGSSGRRVAHMDVEVVDEHDQILPAGHVGEVVCRPRNPFEIMSRYLGMPEATVAAWRNLWFHTGDAGRFDEDGSFYFVDRIKDMIKHHGFSIASFDVEQALIQHPAVAEAAVVPSRTREFDEEIRAFVVAVSGHEIDCANLVAFVSARLAHYMVPRYIDVVAAIPRNGLGKVEKSVLRQRPLDSLTFDRRAAGIELQR